MSVIEFLKARYNIIEGRVPVADVKMFKLYPRVSVDTEMVKLYKMAIELGEKFPPIVLTRDFVLVDGFHRLEAYVLAKKSTIDAVIIEDKIDEQEIFSLAIELNLRHGKKLSKDDMARVKKMLDKEKVVHVISQFAQELFHINEQKHKLVLYKGNFGEQKGESVQEQLLEYLEDEGSEKEKSELDDLEELEEVEAKNWKEDIVQKKKKRVKEGDVEEREEKVDEEAEGGKEGVRESVALEADDVLSKKVEELKRDWLEQTYNLYGMLLGLAKKEGRTQFMDECVSDVSLYVSLFVLSFLRDYLYLIERREKLFLLESFAQKQKKFFEKIFEDMVIKKENWDSKFLKFLERVKQMQT